MRGYRDKGQGSEPGIVIITMVITIVIITMVITIVIITMVITIVIMTIPGSDPWPLSLYPLTRTSGILP